MKDKEEDQEYTEEEHEEKDVYDEKEVEEELESGEIKGREAGFMEGYNREADRKLRSHPKRKKFLKKEKE